MCIPLFFSVKHSTNWYPTQGSMDGDADTCDNRGSVCESTTADEKYPQNDDMQKN